MSFLHDYDALESPDAAASKLKLAVQWARLRPNEFFAELRENRPNFAVPGGPVFITRAMDVKEALDHPKVFTVRLYGQKMDDAVGPFMLGHDETEMNRRDKSVMNALMPLGDTNRIRQFVAELTREAIEQGREGDSLELVSTICRPVPVRLTGRYFGFPGPDEESMMRWSLATQMDFFKNMFNNPDIHAAAKKAGEEMKAYIHCLVDYVRSELENNPEAINNEDVVSRMLRMRLPDSLGFDDERIIANIAGTLIGGVETTSQAVVQIIDQLLQRPAELAAAREAATAGDQAVFDKYVWEALRFNPINPFVPRICMSQYTIAQGTDRNITIPAGTLVLPCTQSAMMDPDLVPDPLTFRTDRADHQYLHFGYGHHRCLGEFVSRVQIPEIVKQIVLAGDLQRAEGDDGQLDFKGGFFPESLIVKISSGKAVGQLV